MLKDELSQIVEAESVASQRLSASIAMINKNKQALQEKLYQELKNAKVSIAEQQRQKVEEAKHTTDAWFNQELEQAKAKTMQEYQYIAERKAKIVEDLVAYMWQEEGKA